MPFLILVIKNACAILGFLSTWPQHPNDLNVEFQDKGQFIYNLYEKIQGVI